MAYLDAATDRLNDKATAEFEAHVEAVRAGTVFAHNGRAYSRWRTASRRRGRGGQAQSGTPVLEGAALESAVRVLAREHPEYVVAGA